VPDIATKVPTTSNGGITNGEKTYTFHLKSGVDWNTSPPRQVTAADFVREFKAFCNPVSPVGNPLYYTATIAGLQKYCSAENAYFANKSHAPSAANIANFQNTHTISGITAVNPSTLKFTLMAPSGRLHLHAGDAVQLGPPGRVRQVRAEQPQLDQHTISDGPYQITSYVPSRSITMMRRTRPGSSPPTRTGISTSTGCRSRWASRMRRRSSTTWKPRTGSPARSG
jgi:peptide/nickel transport system substrate-binding protein